MKFTNKFLFIAQLALTAGLSMSAFAQNQGVQIPQGPMSAHGKPQHLSEKQKSQVQARRAEHRAKRLQELKVFLQLEGNQESAWSSFYAVMQKPVVKPERLKPEELEKLSTPERIDKMMAVKAERDSQMNQRMAAIKNFYASLNRGCTEFCVNGLMAGNRRTSWREDDRKSKESSTQRSHRQSTG